MSLLFTPFPLRGVTCRNRIFVSPMCQYSSMDGMPTEWHLVHLGSRAVGGAGLVMVEATAVVPEGRISPWDSGLWSDAHAEAFLPITRFIEAQGAVAAVQLGHAGRKASTGRPWTGGGAVAPGAGGWIPVGPGNEPFADSYPVPRAMSIADIDASVRSFAVAAGRARDAGFSVLELHAAHGYLLHQFLSPLVNHRDDIYGGSFENRARFPLQVVEAVREVWPEDRPLLVRISATDWKEGGWDPEASVEFSRRLRERGVDLVDCSSGGAVPGVTIPVGPGYQVAFAETIRRQAGIATGAVGMITDPVQAETILATGQADAVFLARQLLRDPHWPLHAARRLGAQVAWPPQYERARPGV